MPGGVSMPTLNVRHFRSFFHQAEHARSRCAGRASKSAGARWQALFAIGALATLAGLGGGVQASEPPASRSAEHPTVSGKPMRVARVETNAASQSEINL